jgi:hypothetical protein
MMLMNKEFHPATESCDLFREPFGEESLSIGMAHLSLTFHGLDKWWRSLIQEMYRSFVLASTGTAGESHSREPHSATGMGETALTHIFIRKAEKDAFLPKVPGELYRIEFFEQENQLYFWSYHFACRYHEREGKGYLAICAQEGLNRRRIIENFMRVVLSYVALERESFFLHSSGVVKDNKAYIFFGPSGAGKTTVARFSKGMPLLSDDQVLVYLKNGKAYASGVPFSGGERFRQEHGAIPSLNVNQEFEIAGFYWLVKDQETFVEPLSLVMGAARLSSTIPFIKDGPFPMQKALNIATEIAKVSKIYSLHFRKDKSLWDII